MTLHAIAMHFTQNIRWLISKDDTIVHDLLSLPGWSIINPLVYRKLYPIFPNEELYTELHFNEILVFNGHALVETDTLIFISTIHLESDNSFSSGFTNYLTSFTSCLRFVSKQAELMGVSYRSFLDLHLNAEEEQNLRNLLIPYFPRSSVLGRLYCKKYSLDTAVRWNSLKIADEILLTGELPVYGTLLLDAIHAVQQNDFRRAILFAAISVESLAASKLDEIYSSFLTNGDPTNMLRIITVQTREGGIKKDPIYESLCAKSRNDFSQLLHERPLYLERRSLRIENESLYQQAIKLHSTRNKIAHSGGLPLEQKDSFFNLDKYGALFAITCAKDVFQWFGITEEYFLPLDNMVSIDEYLP